MKRIALVVAALTVFSLALAACSGDDPTATPTRAAPTATPTQAPPTATPTPLPPGVTAPPPTATATSLPPTPTATLEPSFDAEAYFKGKTIRLVVGFNPGGGTDTQARFYAGNLSDFIPGNPRVVVSNFTPQMAASNFVWNSDPDGFVLQYTAGTLITASFEPASEFIASEFSLIGAPATGNPLWAIRGTLPYGDIKDAMGNLSGPSLIQTGPGSPEEVGGTSMATMLLADWLDIPIEYKVVASAGTEQTLLMLERGDVNAWTVTPGSSWFTLPARRPGWWADGYMKPFAGLLTPGQEIKPNSEISFNATNGRDLLDDSQKAIFDAFTPPDVIALKHLAGPPGMDPNVLSVLRKAWDDAVADAEFNAKMAKVLGSEVSALPGAQLQEMYTAVVDGYREKLSELEPIQQRLFDKYIR